MLHFESFAEFIEMGGHGFYIWLCYGIVLASLIGHLIIARKGVERSKAKLSRYYRQIARREQMRNN